MTNHPGCQGWQQFTYQQNDFQPQPPQAYWPFGTRYSAFGLPCPTSSWIPTGSDCYLISQMRVSVPGQVITNLGPAQPKGQANSGGMDTVILSTGTNMYMANGQDSFLNLAPNLASPPSSTSSALVVDPRPISTTDRLLSFGRALMTGPKWPPPAPRTARRARRTTSPWWDPQLMVMMGTSPAIVFTQSNGPGGTPPGCATSAGDTHLMTVDGLFYDFQPRATFCCCKPIELASGPGATCSRPIKNLSSKHGRPRGPRGGRDAVHG